jgi:hypothetical protein
MVVARLLLVNFPCSPRVSHIEGSFSLAWISIFLTPLRRSATGRRVEYGHASNSFGGGIGKVSPCSPNKRSSVRSFYLFSESIRRIRNRPTYADANMGHPDWFAEDLSFRRRCKSCRKECSEKRASGVLLRKKAPRASGLFPPRMNSEAGHACHGVAVELVCSSG